ncbi:MAG: cytochrome b/b6 domain-containing protein [Caulobacteraceae bacterium]|nr:cytochrome b/b6 domain-containing protein [Caulobacteraceae bacterium]
MTRSVPAPAARYASVAILLHWAIALAILANILVGWWMSDAIDVPATMVRAIAAFQLHKSLGLTVLALSLVRLAWRLVNPPPPLPQHMPAWERLAAHAAHVGLYGLMIALPLSGWLYVSAGWSVPHGRPLVIPTVYFGLFKVPHLFGLEAASLSTRAGVAGGALEAHELFVWAALGLAAAHVGAALKHWVIDRDQVLSRMVPGLPSLGPAAPLPPPAPGRRVALIAGFAAILIGALAFLHALKGPTPPAPPAPVSSAPAASSAIEASASEASAPSASGAPDSGSVAAAAKDQPAATKAPPAVWTIDPAASSIRFSGTYAGAPFDGVFSSWTGTIRFDPDNLEPSSAVITVKTASATDGNPVHDQTLPQGEWLDSADKPTATFKTSRFRHIAGDRYEARGTLTLKGKALPVALPFTLTLKGDRAKVTGEAMIDRAQADIGMSSDAAGAYVSKTIKITVSVTARRAAP